MFTLPELPYTKDSMESFTSAETFDFHHGKHHAGYVKKLNNAVEGTDLAKASLEDVIKKAHAEGNTGLFNNAAQHWNHSFFWKCFTPEATGTASGKIAEMIDADFGSFDAFKDQFSKAAATLFGAGWVWLVENNGKLEILDMSNAGTPLTEGKKALLTIDVWEHAYYIDHRNARATYIEKFWDFVNWDHVNSLLI
jgi:superoxide dismutase, Fe-Mn family